MKSLLTIGLVVAAFGLRGAEDKIILCSPARPPAAMENVWTAKGWRIKTGLTATASEKVVGVFLSGLNVGDANAERVAGYARGGATLFLGVGKTGLVVPAALQEWLPVNAWSFKSRLERDGCQLEGMGVSKDVSVSRRFDMHVPGSAIESPMARYFPDQYYRDPEVVTRFAVLDRCKGDGGLPMLVDADVRGARVIVFAGDLLDPKLTGSDGFAEWGKRLAGLPFEAERPAGTVPRPATAAPVLDARRPYSIVLEEDEATLGELTKELQPPEGTDGITSYRYVYRPGTAPKLKVRIRNHLANIAPLAQASDLKWPENYSAGGLNDMVFTHASVRGKLPMHGVWCGRSAAEQAVRLAWPSEARIAGFRLTGCGPYRNRYRNNPKAFVLSAGGKTLLRGESGEFVNGSSEERATWERMLADDVTADSVDFTVTGLDPAASGEPKFENNLGVSTFNCALTEMEVWGWCGETGSKLTGTLTVSRTDLETRETVVEATKSVSVGFCREAIEELTLTPLRKFGPVRWDFVLETAEVSGRRVLARQSFNVLYIPAEGNKVRPKTLATTAEYGLLCSPGWRNLHPFGIGMNNWSSGWGGANDKTWALSLDLMELGTKNIDDPTRMLTTSAQATHYTSPWRRFPNGDWSWSLVEDAMVADMLPGGRMYKSGKTSLHVVGSDRWNGVQANTSFTWDDFMRFDQWLRRQGGQGLKGRSRRQIIEEITSSYGDRWQVFLLDSYADLMLAAKARFAALGIPFSFETHGSFPLCGGELGAKLAQTHLGVGTDVFWDLDRQDLWGTLGLRYAVVAANPDLISGAYEQWGWVNSEQNDFWFASNGDEEVARRHWYATYFVGRVGLDGAFRPYHELGYGSQGDHGVKYMAKDHTARCRVHNLVTELRPEAATGIGLVASWVMQEKKMGPEAGTLGFGLYPAKGAESLTESFRRVYSALVKQGVPISFVTSTHALKEWKGSQPLILLDGDQWESWEKSAAAAVRRRGAALFNVSSAQVADVASARTCAETIRRQLGSPLVVSDGLTVVPFVSNGRLFLSVCRQGDGSAPGEITLKPGAFHKASAGATRVISLDDGRALKVFPEKGGAIRFLFPMEPYSARLLMVVGSDGRRRASVSALPGTDFDGSVLTLAFEPEDFPPASAQATLTVGDQVVAGAPDAEKGTVAFELGGDLLGRGVVRAGLVRIADGARTDSYPLTFEQGRVTIVRADDAWICETAASLGESGTWSAVPEITDGTLHLSGDSSFVPNEPSAESSVVTLEMSVMLGVGDDQPDEGAHAGLRVVSDDGIGRYVFATASGPVTNREVEAVTDRPVDLRVRIDYRDARIVYEIDNETFGPYPIDSQAKAVSQILFYGEGGLDALLGAYETRVVDPSVAQLGETTYDSLEKAAAAAGDGTIDLLWDASWSPTGSGNYAVRLNGNRIVFGGDLLSSIRENGDGTVTVTVESGLEGLQLGRLDLVGDRVTIGVIGAKPGFLYGIARCESPGGAFWTDDAAWVRGEDLVSGTASLSVAKASQARSEFFKVISKVAR